MNRFSYLRAASVEEAVREVAGDPTARFIAGGTNLIDLMKYNVERPDRLIDITHLPPEELVASILKKEQRIAEIMGNIRDLLTKQSA